MYACSVRQPFTAGLVFGPKPLENRQTNIFASVRPGEWVAFHAAKQLYEMDERSWRWFKSVWLDAPVDEDDPRMAKGVVLGAGRYVGTVTDQTLHMAMTRIPELRAGKDWFGGPFAGCFDRRIALPKPIACRGMLGLWKLPEEIEGAVRVEVAKLGQLPPVPPLASPATDGLL